MPSAPTMMSASISLPSARRTTPPRSHSSTAMQRAPKRKSTVLTPRRSTSSKSARCIVRLGAPNCWRNAPRRIREMTRPLFQLRMIRKSDSHPRAMTASSTPRTRSASSALGLRLRPAPISFSAGDCSQTTISAPHRSSASAAARPPTPPPTMAMRGARLIHAVQFADVWRGISATAHLCRSRTPGASFDHLVGAGEQRGRHFEAEHPCGLSVNDELELAHLLDRQFPRLYTLEDATGIDADDTPRIRDVGPVAHQPAGFGDFTRGGCHGNRVARRHGGQLNPPAVEKSAGADEEGIGPLADKRCKCGIDLAAVGSVEDPGFAARGHEQPFRPLSARARSAQQWTDRSALPHAPLWALAHAAVPGALPP